MKKLFFALVFALVFGVSTVLAEPFLVCDPQTGVVSYDLDINGTITTGITAQPDGSIYYDLVGMAVGSYVFRARALDQGGWPSDWSLPLDSMKPANPLNLRVSSE